MFKNLKLLTTILTTLLFFTSTAKSYAIDWIQVPVNKGKVAYIDKDSILNYENKYYFYNIKYKIAPTDSFKILTVQSAMHNSFSARLQLYTEKEYEELKGDYNNITKTISQKLEAPAYGSIIHSCHKIVRELMETSSKPTITFE